MEFFISLFTICFVAIVITSIICSTIKDVAMIKAGTYVDKEAKGNSK